MGTDHPLRCVLADNVVSITLDSETLKIATEHHPALSDLQIMIEDVTAFAKDVVMAMNAEREDGSTLVTDMLDAAIEQAVEQGSVGMRYD